MAHPRMRPQFDRLLACAPVAFWAALETALATSESPVRGRTFASGAILRLRGSEKRIWSPALYVSIEHDVGGEQRLHGRFSPSSPVWTAFVAIYIALTTLGLGALCWGGAQWTMQQAPWALLGVPVALALAAFTYGAALIGQGLGADDMYALRTFVERVAEQVSGRA